MRKKQSEITPEEWWELFPVFLTGHQECWYAWYREEEAALRGLLADRGLVRISHVGSTAVDGIWARPIIDILAEMAAGSCLKELEEPLARCGYRRGGAEGRYFFCKGRAEDETAERMFQLYLRYEGDNDELYFRDYLRMYGDVAREYERMKFKLWEKRGQDGRAYAGAKADFVRRYTERAKKEFGAYPGQL